MEQRKRREEDHWIDSHWRPMMAWQYLVVCLFDFLIGPLFNAWFAYTTHTALTQWVPLTLQGGGLYHLAMGAIVGITSYAKTQERVAITNSGQLWPNQPNMNGYSNGMHPNFGRPPYQNNGQPSAPIVDRDAQLDARNRVINPNPDPDPPR